MDGVSVTKAVTLLRGPGGFGEAAGRRLVQRDGSEEGLDADRRVLPLVKKPGISTERDSVALRGAASV